MESKVIDLLKQINVYNNIVLPVTYENVIFFDLSFDQIDVDFNNIEGTQRISSLTYNKNREMFERFKEALAFNHRNLSETESLSENVFVCVSILEDIQIYKVEVHFN